MDTRAVTYTEAADLLTSWADRRLPLGVPSDAIDFSIEDACDGLCCWLADDPERDLDDVPHELLQHLATRIMFAVGVCVLEKDNVIGRVPVHATDAEVLAALLGVQIAGTKIPPEWRRQ